MPSLGNQSVASSFDRLLALPGGGGDGTNLITLTDGNAATTFGLKLSTTSISVPSTGKVYLDGGNNTYIQQNGDDILDIVVGGATMMKFTETTTDKIDILSEIYVGVDDIGHDVKFYGATSGAYMQWDESADRLKLVSAGQQDMFQMTTVNTSIKMGEDVDLDNFFRIRLDTGTGIHFTPANDVPSFTILQDTNIGIGTATADGSATKQLMIYNGNGPSAHTDNQIYIGARNASTTSESTLALFCEEDPETSTTWNMSQRMKIWINGTEYWIALDAV